MVKNHTYQTISFEEGIMIVTYKPNLETITIDIAKILLSERLAASNGQTFPCFLDSTNIKSITKDARHHLSTPAAHKGVSAFALLTRSSIAKLSANVYLILNPPKVPSKLFLNQNNAMRWLKHFRHMN